MTAAPSSRRPPAHPSVRRPPWAPPHHQAAVPDPCPQRESPTERGDALRAFAVPFAVRGNPGPPVSAVPHCPLPELPPATPADVDCPEQVRHCRDAVRAVSRAAVLAALAPLARSLGVVASSRPAGSPDVASWPTTSRRALPRPEVRAVPPTPQVDPRVRQGAESKMSPLRGARYPVPVPQGVRSAVPVAFRS